MTLIARRNAYFRIVFLDKLCRHQIKTLHFAYTISMYEVTLSTPNNHSNLLNYIHNDLQPYVAKIGGTYAILQQKHRTYFSIACDDTFTFQAKRLLIESISQVLALGYKNIFIRDLLDIEQNNFYQHVLVDTMCIFDHVYDAKMITNLIDVEKDMYLDGYYNFLMQDFKRKWQNVANMILENDYVLADNSLILEFLQYLLQSVDTKTKTISICMENYDYTLYDSKNSLLPKSNTMSMFSTAETDVLVNAVYLNAQKLKVYHHGNLSQDFCNVANALFQTEFVQVD